ncbi:MAG: hypothetical protein K6G90_11075 [Clostridia bacterium]|nr:hypothetical protein [Clostridia bacterium]
MKLELEYDPVFPKLDVTINGEQTNRNDPFGFLYAYSGRIIQSWINGLNHVNGFAYELNSLRRGDYCEIVFRGRESDYEDFQTAIKNERDIVCKFEAKDVVSEYKDKIDSSYELISNFISEKYRFAIGNTSGEEVKQSFSELFHEESGKINDYLKAFKEADGFVNADDETSFSTAKKSIGTCVRINGDIFESFSGFETVESLYSGLQRAPGMVFCVFSDTGRADLFKDYAKTKGGMLSQVSIVISDAEIHAAETESKYIQTAVLREKIKYIKRIISILDNTLSTKDDLQEQIDTLQNSTTIEQTLKRIRLDRQLQMLTRLYVKMQEFPVFFSTDF